MGIVISKSLSDVKKVKSLKTNSVEPIHHKGQEVCGREGGPVFSEKNVKKFGLDWGVGLRGESGSLRVEEGDVLFPTDGREDC